MIEKSENSDKNYVLFDNIADPYQLNNIAEENMDIVQKLISGELIPWLDKTNDSWLE